MELLEIFIYIADLSERQCHCYCRTIDAKCFISGMVLLVTSLMVDMRFSSVNGCTELIFFIPISELVHKCRAFQTHWHNLKYVIVMLHILKRQLFIQDNYDQY